MSVPSAFGMLFALMMRPRQVLLPLLLVSLLATGVSFLPAAAGIMGRWLLLAALATVLLARRKSLGSTNPALVLTLAVYVLWCGLTSFWSEAPFLSLSKVAGLALAVFAGFWAGQEWAVSHTRDQAFSFAWPMAALTLAAGLMRGNIVFHAGGVALHAGATMNPNFLGAIVSMSIPFVIWKVNQHRRSRRDFAIWLLILAVYLVILYLTASRGSYLILFGTAGGLLLATKARQMVMVIAGAAWLAGLLTVLAPGLAGSWVKRNIYKQSDVELGLFHRRAQVWADSYDAAIVGGIAGVGYGVSLGSSLDDIDSLFTTQFYTREKGNSQLAIVEETGLIGLVLYLALLAALFRELLAGFRRSPLGELRILRGLVVGTLAGLLLHSFLEAWWVGPGSPEFIFFWVMAGTGVALARIARTENPEPTRIERAAPTFRPRIMSA